MLLKLFNCAIATLNVELTISNVSLSLHMYKCALQMYKHKQKNGGSSTDLNEVCAYVFEILTKKLLHPGCEPAISRVEGEHSTTEPRSSSLRRPK